MIIFRIISVGRAGEKWIEAGCAHYRKMLSRHARLEEIIVKQHRLSSSSKIQTALNQEGELILKQLADSDPVIALDERGELYDSMQFTGKIESYLVGGYSALSFVIGSAHGLAKCVKSRANLCLSLSKMTFPHELARLLLVEQLYRSMSILGGSKYHK